MAPTKKIIRDGWLNRTGICNESSFIYFFFFFNCYEHLKASSVSIQQLVVARPRQAIVPFKHHIINGAHQTATKRLLSLNRQCTHCATLVYKAAFISSNSIVVKHVNLVCYLWFQQCLSTIEGASNCLNICFQPQRREKEKVDAHWNCAAWTFFFFFFFSFQNCHLSKFC